MITPLSLLKAQQPHTSLKAHPLGALIRRQPNIKRLIGFGPLAFSLLSLALFEACDDPDQHPKQDTSALIMSAQSKQVKGVAGLELMYDDELKARLSDTSEGAPKHLMLTIDTRIQQITEAYLKDAVRSTEALGGVALVMDPNNGDLLAMAQVPSYDPNQTNAAQANTAQAPSSFTHQAISSVFEPGSLMKPLVIAAALEEGVLDEDTIIPGYDGTYELGPFKLQKTHKEGGGYEDPMLSGDGDTYKVGPFKITEARKVTEQTIFEVLQHSSSIGAIHVAQRLGSAKLFEYMTKFGLGSLTGVELTQEQPGALANLTTLSPEEATLYASTWAYGYGLNATPLQMTTAISAIANGGELFTPRIVKALLNEEGEVIERFEPQRKARVVSERAAKIVKEGLQLVTEEGTGLAARVSGYDVAGKTGTTRKYVSKANGESGYQSGGYLASFVGFAPVESPRVVIYVLIDEPQVGPNGGGAVAGPVFSKIAEELLPYLGVSPTRAHREYKPANKGADKGAGEHPKVLKTTRHHQPWWSKDGALHSKSKPNLEGKDAQ